MSDDPDFIALVVSRDERFRQLQLAINVEADQRDNPTLRAFLAAIRADMELAVAELADVSPLDGKAIGALQVRIGSYTHLKRIIETILTRGKLAEEQIRQQDAQFGDERDE
jgi:hypothetical protein